MTIGLITDTNFFAVNPDNRHIGPYFLNELNYFIDYANSLSNIKSKNKLIYYVPEIVIEELYHQKKDAFETKYNKMKAIYDELTYALNGELPTQNIEEILKKEKEDYYQKVNVLKLDYNKDLFMEIVGDALSKNLPFDKHKPNVGFKDSLIWKTVLYSKEVDNCDIVFFFSGDKIFTDGNNDKILIEEFKKKHSNVELRIIHFSPNGNQRQDALNKIIDEFKLPKTEVIKLYDKKLILKYLKDLVYYNDDVEYYIGDGVQTQLTNIQFNDFDITDFSIINVNKNKTNYNVKCTFKTKKYNTTISLEEDIKKFLIGDIELLINENQNKYDCLESKITGVDFDLDVIDLFRGLVLNRATSIMSQVMEVIKENVEINYDRINPMKELQENLKVISAPLKQTKEKLSMISAPLKQTQETIKKIANPLNISKSIITFDNGKEKGKIEKN